MVCGCGMNGRSREARSSSGGQSTKKQQASSHHQRTSQKPRPPAEALQMARILEDSKQTSEMNSKVEAVLAIVPGCTEEQIHLALHDNGFDLEKAISALLDSDGLSNEGEWTTTSSRKARKKGVTTDSEEPSHSKSTSIRPNNRMGSNSTRDNVGSGGTSNTGTGGRGRGHSNRSKGQSLGRRPRGSGTAGDQRRSRMKDKEKSIPQNNHTKAIEEEWDTLPVGTGEQIATTTRATESWESGEVWQMPLADHSTSTNNKYWESVDEPEELPSQQNVHPPSQLEPLFPEAIPVPDRPLHLHSTPSEITPVLPYTGNGERDSHIQQPPLDTREKSSGRPKRLARSRIPTKPVEMPAGIESLDVQFGELGIDFVGLESRSSPPPDKEVDVETSVASMLPPYSDLQQRFGDSSARVSISTSSSSTALGGETAAIVPPDTSYRSSTEHQLSTSEGEREVPTSIGLRSPPGLPHPSSSSATSNDQQLSPQQQQGEGSLSLSSEVATSQQSSVETQLNLQEVPASSSVLKAAPIDLPMELPKRQTNPPQTTAIEQPFSSVASSASDKLMFSTSASASHSVTSSTSLTSATASRSSAVTPSLSSHHQLTQQQQAKPSGSSVPPGMLYPHMMPAQYPFIPAPAMYNYDPNDMGRYSSAASMAYFPTSSDPSMGGAMSSRDHTPSTFQSEQTKFGTQRGTADLSTPVAVSSTQQNQQSSSLAAQQPGAGQPTGSGQMGPAFMGTPFYGSMFYPTMYGPMPAFSQAANFGMSYEEMLAAAAAAPPASHDYSKIYAGGSASSLNKPSSLTVSSSGAIDSSALAGAASSSYKHLDSGKSYNYSVPAAVGGSQAPYYNVMQMPFHHMMVGPAGAGGHEVGHSRISSQKHSNKVGGGGYQGNSGSANYWSSGAAHTS